MDVIGPIDFPPAALFTAAFCLYVLFKTRKHK